MYKALVKFTDLQDSSFLYNAGDEYPRKGYSPSADRVEELLSSNNRRGRPVIEKVEAEPEVKPEAPEKAEPKPNRARKKK